MVCIGHAHPVTPCAFITLTYFCSLRPCLYFSCPCVCPFRVYVAFRHTLHTTVYKTDILHLCNSIRFIIFAPVTPYLTAGITNMQVSVTAKCCVLALKKNERQGNLHVLFGTHNTKFRAL